MSDTDPQQQKVCDLESEMWNATVAHNVTMAKLRQLIDGMCKYWKVQPAEVRRLPSGFRHIADCGDGIIRLGRKNGGRTAWTAAHEVAHHVCDEKYILLGNEIQPHGPEWTTVFILTLDIFRIMPLVASVPLFKAYSVKFNQQTVDAYRKEGKRAGTRLRQNLVRKARQVQWPTVDSVFATGRLRDDRHGAETMVLVWLY